MDKLRRLTWLDWYVVIVVGLAIAIFGGNLVRSIFAA